MKLTRKEPNPKEREPEYGLSSATSFGKYGLCV
jgi:hypothetical protein